MIIKGSITGETTYDSVILGYCPTMQPVAEKIADNNEYIVLVAQQSSAQVLQALHNNDIDVALIGRKARQDERLSANERILEEGYTLVTAKKKFIQEEELAGIKVHTALAQDIAEQLLPGSEIVLHPTTQEAVANGLAEAVLINWNEYNDQYALLVVMQGSQKAQRFRTPILYAKDQDLEHIRIRI